jgi:hypothetical protein
MRGSIHPFPIRLRGVVFNQLRTETNLPLCKRKCNERAERISTHRFSKFRIPSKTPRIAFEKMLNNLFHSNQRWA